MLAAYLIGSFSPAYWLGHLMRGIDLREVGSGNLGARNAGRELGRHAGIAVWILDMCKGAGAVLLARAVGSPAALQIAAGAAAVTGHNWPVFHGFRGGRGASTAMGAAFVLAPLGMLAGFAVWIAVSLTSHSFYLGGVVGFVAAAVAATALGGGTLAAASPLLVAVPLVLRHVPAIVLRVRTRRLDLP